MAPHGFDLRVQFDGDRFVADDGIVDLYGVGATQTKAIEDYWTTVQEAYDDLSANEGRLSPYLQQQLEHLRWITQHASKIDTGKN